MTGKGSLEKTIGEAPCCECSRGRIIEKQQDVCIEEVVTLTLNGRTVARLVASPDELEELGAGFVTSEGLAGKVHDVRIEGLAVHVTADERARPAHPVIESCGGPGMGVVPSRVESPLVIEQDLVFTVISHIVSDLWERTGGAHCSVLVSEGRLVAKSSDIGRHNTVDKVIGHAVLSGIDLSRCVLGCTGRQPAGMVSKAANAGIPIVVSKTATTREGARIANQAGVTLVCRAKEGSFCVFSHPWRIAGISEHMKEDGS